MYLCKICVNRSFTLTFIKSLYKWSGINPCLFALKALPSKDFGLNTVTFNYAYLLVKALSNLYNQAESELIYEVNIKTRFES
jgi:hypothetical protein